MRKPLHFIMGLVLAFCTIQTKAQLADGSTAPNFTFTDMNGNTQDLYTYLNAGKVVVIDVSAIWCGPCWNYHKSGNLEAFYNQYGPPGTNQAMVLYIEGDGATSDQCMTNAAGCTGGPSQGNWVSGTPYPMCNPVTALINAFNTAYKIAYFPTMYMICPNKLTTKVDQFTTAQLSNAMMKQCPPVVAALDAAASDISSPVGFACSTSISPTVTVRNLGSSPLTSCTINYKVDNGTPQTFSWTGNLATWQSASAAVPSIATTGGAHTLTAFTSNPNASTDGNPANDQVSINYNAVLTGVAVPITEGFAGGVIPPAGWALGNPDGDYTWALNAVGGFGNGTNSAAIDCYDYAATGATDFLISQPMNFSTAAAPNLTFSVAYAPYDASTFETLDVEASSDCGTTWTSVYSKSGATLGTAPATTAAFTPTAAQWRTETVSLSSYIGQSSVMVRFKCTNGFGNWIFIDDINIMGASSVNEIDLSSSVSVFPTPSSGNFSVNINSSNFGHVSLTVYDVLGKVVSEITDNISSPKKYNFDLSENPSGMYFIEVKTNNGRAIKKTMINK